MKIQEGRVKSGELSRDLIGDAHAVPDRDGLFDPWHPKELAAR